MLTFVKGLLVGGLIVSNVYSIAIVKVMIEKPNTSRENVYRDSSREPWSPRVSYK